MKRKGDTAPKQCRPAHHPALGPFKVLQPRASQNGTEQPRTTRIRRRPHGPAKRDHRENDGDGDGRTNALGQQRRTEVAPCVPQHQHLGKHDRASKASVKGQQDAMPLYPQHRLACQMKCSPVRGHAQQDPVEPAEDQMRRRGLRPGCRVSFHELSHPTPVRQRVGQDHARNRPGKGVEPSPCQPDKD